MKKMKLAQTLIQGVALVAFAGGIYVYTQTQIKPQEVWTFSRDIPVNTTIQEGDLTKKIVPKDAVTNDMITNLDEVVGKVTTSKSFPGQYVLRQQLVNAEEVDELTHMDLSNYRKVTISTDSVSAVGGNIKKGDRVDLAYVRSGSGKENPNNGTDNFTYAKIFMQDVLVYNVLDDGGNRYIDKTEGNTTVVDAEGNPVESGNISMITFALPADKAEELEARLKDGQIKIFGRFDDSSDVKTNGYTIGDYKDVPTHQANPEK